MRKHLLSLLTAGIALTASSAEVEFSYNLNGAEPEGFGYDQEQTYDIGVALDSPQVTGKRIVGFSVPIFDSDYVSDVTAWLSTELKTSKETPPVFTPDVASYEVTVADGMINFTLPEPYTIPDKGIFVGYSFTVSGLPEGYTAAPVAVVTGISDGGLWVHATESQYKWAQLSKRKKQVSSMTVTLEGDFPQNAANIYADTKQVYAVKDQPSYAQVIIDNWGSNPVSSFEYSYIVDGREMNGHYDFESPVPAVLGRRATAEIELAPVAELGDHEAKVTITNINGAANEMTADMVSIPLAVQPFIAEYRPLVEEFTGLRCGWCPRGYVMLEQMKLEYGEKFVAMAYHSGGYESGAMVYMNDYNFPVQPRGLPAASFNRNATTDPSNIPELWRNSQGTNAPAEIAVELEWADESQTKLVANAKTRFIHDISEADYVLSFALVADGLHNPTWAQSNSYADYEATGEYAGPYWDLFVGKDSHVFGLTFNDVVVYYPDVEGIEGSLPSSINAGEWYDYTFEVEIDQVRNIAGENNVNDFNKTRIIAIVLNKTDGKPLNCISSLYPDGTEPGVDSIEEIEGDNNIVDSIFYDLQGRPIANPTRGLYIRMDKLSDGTVKTSKELL